MGIGGGLRWAIKIMHYWSSKQQAGATLKENLKIKPEEMGILAFGIIIIALLLATPFILVAGLNFLLEAGGYPELPYNLNTWVGSAIILFSLKLRVEK